MSNKHDSKLKFKDKRRKIIDTSLKKQFKIKECSIFLDKIDVTKFKRIRNFFIIRSAIPQSPGVSGSSAVSFLKRFTPWLFQPPQLTKESLCDRSNTQKNIRHEIWSGVNTHVPANQRKHSKVQQFMNDFQQKKKNCRKIKI